MTELSTEPQGSGLLAMWRRCPLYIKILGAAILGAIVGVTLKGLAEPREAIDGAQPILTRPVFDTVIGVLELLSRVVLQLLGALAAPLVLLAVVQALMNAQLPKGSAVRLVSLLALNTLVAISIGLLVANVVAPGRWTRSMETPKPLEKPLDPFAVIVDNLPRSLLGPLSDGGKVIAVIIIAVAFGIALRRLKATDPRVETLSGLIDIGFRGLLIVLHWVIQIIPLAVFGVVASKIGKDGFQAFIALGAFVLAVILALLLQTAYYLLRIKFGCWASPMHVLRGMRDALVMAFSTASSTATMPVTYACLRQRVGLREQSASLGGLVGANFNNDGTALYEAMSALFVSQLIGLELTLTQQALVVLTSVFASVGAAGIPEAGLVTMVLVFKAVGLPTEYIAVLLTTDWFLDRCRTTVNVLGDVNVSCMLDGRTREVAKVEPAAAGLGEITSV